MSEPQFIQLNDDVHVFFPQTSVLLRGYTTGSVALRRLTVRRMNILSNYVYVLLAITVVSGWLTGWWGLCLSLWFLASEFIYAVGVPRLTRRMQRLSLFIGWQIYTAKYAWLDLLIMTIIFAQLGFMVIVFGWIVNDITLIGFAVVPIFVVCRLIAVLLLRCILLSKPGT